MVRHTGKGGSFYAEDMYLLLNWHSRPRRRPPISPGLTGRLSLGDVTSEVATRKPTMEALQRGAAFRGHYDVGEC